MFSKFTLKQSVGWIMAIVGTAAYLTGYIWKYNAPDLFWPDLLIKIGDVLIIGVVVGYLTGIAQWAGIFKREIQDIVFGREFLDKRNDIEQIWYNVTKQMFKFKFSEIHNDLLNSLKHILPGENDISYYEDYDADTKIEWFEKERGLIKSIDTFAMYIVADSEKEFTYSIKSWTVVDNDSEKEFKSSLQVNLDGIKVPDSDTTTRRIGNEICSEAKIKLQGKKRYFIQYTREKIYNINEDYYIAYKAQYLTKNLRVSLELPVDIDALFIERGTTENFKNVNNSKHHIKKIYKGVVFPRQGYIFALKVQ